jgi:hypothetical protein
MAETVTIEGTITPCAELKRFERATVTFDEHVANLVRNGFVRIVARHGDPEAELAALLDEEVPEPESPAEPAVVVDAPDLAEPLQAP